MLRKSRYIFEMVAAAHYAFELRGEASLLPSMFHYAAPRSADAVAALTRALLAPDAPGRVCGAPRTKPVPPTPLL